MRQEELWDRLYGSNPSAWRGNSRIPHPNMGRVLDLGCGNGKTVSTLIDMGYDVVGADFSSVAIDACRDIFGDSARFEVCRVQELPFPDSSFDYVTAVHVLEHLDPGEIAEAASEIARVLVPGGYLFVRSFTGDDMRSESRRRGEIRYVYRSVDEMVSAFGSLETVSAELVEETTRFGALRSRVECLFRRPL